MIQPKKLTPLPVLLLLFIIIPFLSFSQVRTNVSISGRVTDENTQPMSGVTVLLADAINGNVQTVQTDVNGFYSFNNVLQNTSYNITFSYVGYEDHIIRSQQYRGQPLVLNVNMAIAAASVQEEVVVVGYGKTRKGDLTGAVKSVKSAAFNQGIINSPEQLLQGKVAGVNITSASGEPGAIQNITVRGPGGLRTGNTPLYVVDGLALDNAGVGGFVNPLGFINPQDIETIDVLKDASATAIYGSRGANGVVIITTKKGSAGSSVFNYSFVQGTSKIAKELPVFSADEYRQHVVNLGGTLEDFGGNTNWQNEVTRVAQTQNHNLSIAGGNKGMTYYASFGMQLQEGILKGNDLKRYNGRLNISQKLLNDRLVVDASLSVNNINNQRSPVGDLIGNALATNPTIPAYNADGTPFQFENGINPLLVLKLEKEKTNTNRIIGNLGASFTILEGLVYRFNFGIDNSTSGTDVQSLPNLVPLRLGRLDMHTNNNKNYLVENYLTYTKKFGDHQLTILGGHSYQNVFVQARGTSINRFPVNGVEPIYDPGTGQELTLATNRPYGRAVINELQSFFSRINYNYKNRYLLTATFRADGSTKFGENNKYGYFPSFSGAWVISNEDFFDSGILTSLKLRGGWGQTGNQEIDSKITKALFTSNLSNSYPLYPTGDYPGGTTYARLANPDLQWEVSAQTDIGLDFELFNGKISGTVDYFRKITSNILLRVVPADPIQPAQTVWNNVKDMRITNEGLEIDLHYKNRTQGGLTYSIGGNATFIKNNVTNSPYSVISVGTAAGSGLSSATINGYVNNQPIGTFYLLKFIGFDENGMSMYEDTDKNGEVNDADRQPLGTALPNFMYNFYGSLEYKGFDFSVNFNGLSGNKLYDNTANSLFYKLRLSKGLNTTPEAIQYAEEDVNNSAPVSSRFLKDGRFLRLNNMSVGYSFNTQKLGISNWVKALRVSFTAQNLFVSTPYNGYDPEVNTDRSGDFLSYGIDYLSYPKPRTFQAAVNITF